METKEIPSAFIKGSTDLLKNAGSKALELSMLSTGHELQSSRKIIKSLKAKANAKRTIFEKFADFSTSVAGSFSFLLLNLLWFLGWILINTNTISVPGIVAFDPFPFGLLTMIVSLEAIALAILVLISQNRASKIDDIREEIDLQVNVTAEQEITKIPFIMFYSRIQVPGTPSPSLARTLAKLGLGVPGLSRLKLVAQKMAKAILLPDAVRFKRN